MRTLFYSSIYMDGPDSGGTMYDRVIKFLKYYHPQKVIKYDQFWLIDNGSHDVYRYALRGYIGVMHHIAPPEKLAPLNYFREEHLERGHNLDHPYAWRAHYELKKIIDTNMFDKIICIDTDNFVLSTRLAKAIDECETGWRSLWCPKYNFPDGNFVLCRDSFKLFTDFIGPTLEDAMKHNNSQIPAESQMPFTHIHKEFNADRFGEDRIPQSPEMDLYCQCPVDIPMVFNMEAK